MSQNGQVAKVAASAGGAAPFAYFFACPHCGGGVVVESNQVNCGIYRHGIVKATGAQVPPHERREVCERLAREGLIVGCGRPFRFDGSSVAACGYI